MKAERDSPLTLVASTLLDPLSIPAIFLSNTGEILQTNAHWTTWCQSCPNVGAKSPLTDFIAPDYQSRFTQLLSDRQQGGCPTAQFATIDLKKVLHLTSFSGADSWAQGHLGLLLPLADVDVSTDLLLRWDRIFGSEQHGIWDINFLTGSRYYSTGWKKLRGYAIDADLGGEQDAWIERVHPNDRHVVMKRREALHKGKTDSLFDEYRERHADGHWIWIMSRGTVVSRDTQGLPTRIIGTDTNVSHLKLSADHDEEVSKRLQLAISASNFGTWEYDIKAGTVTWDQNTRAIYGIEAPQHIWPQDIWQEFLHPDDRDAILAQTARALSQRSDIDLSFRILRRDGTIRHVLSRATHVLNTEGRESVIGITWDVTDEAEQAAEIEAAYALVKVQNKALERARADMELRSNHDALTGLANRRRLDQFQQDLIAQTDGTEQRCAVVHIDLDRFKTINDTLGHAAGDAVLKHVADLLREAAPPGSLVSRVGGDEFVIVISNAPSDEMLSHWAQEVINVAKRPLSVDGHRCRFGLSIGIATGTFDQCTSDNLFSNADLALYDAKNKGRGRVHFFHESQKLAAEAKRCRSDEILSAIEQKQFCCHYQPQYDRTGQRLTGVEALARWNHPTLGLLTPDAFLAYSEDLGVIDNIDQQILDCALADADRWHAAGRALPQLSVNVSGRRLMDPHLPDQIAHLTDCRHALVFELLETVFLDEADAQLQANLQVIRDLGISIDIDDFGSGHASIVGLMNLRPDRIKIDRQLIGPATQNHQQRDLVKSIVEIGRVMGLSVVAEGVETAAHVELLRDIGCDYLQGYGLCSPLPPAEIIPLLPVP